jgi:phosphopantetheinyl transferase
VSEYFVIANSRAVGIDVEKVRNNFPVEMVARDAFSTVGFDELMAIDPALRLDTFFTCWTRKEAWFKAKGEGFSALLRPVPQPSSPALLRKNPSRARGRRLQATIRQSEQSIEWVVRFSR